MPSSWLSYRTATHSRSLLLMLEDLHHIEAWHHQAQVYRFSTGMSTLPTCCTHHHSSKVRSNKIIRKTQCQACLVPLRSISHNNHKGCWDMHQMLMLLLPRPQQPLPTVPRAIRAATSVLFYCMASLTDRIQTRLCKMASQVMTSLHTIRRVGMNIILLFQCIFRILR